MRCLLTNQERKKRLSVQMMDDILLDPKNKNKTKIPRKRLHLHSHFIITLYLDFFVLLTCLQMYHKQTIVYFDRQNSNIFGLRAKLRKLPLAPALQKTLRLWNSTRSRGSLFEMQFAEIDFYLEIGKHVSLFSLIAVKNEKNVKAKRFVVWSGVWWKMDAIFLT